MKIKGHPQNLNVTVCLVDSTRLHFSSFFVFFVGGVDWVQVVMEFLAIAFCTARHHQYATMKLNMLASISSCESECFIKNRVYIII